MKNKNYNNYYDRIGNEYNSIRLDPKNEMEYVIEVIRKYVYSENAKILDIGCGTGKYGEMMQKNGYKVIGIDKSEKQIKQSQQLIESHLANATNLPFDDNSFDVCTMIMMIQQLSKEERIKAFKEVYRVLNNNGTLIIKTCSHDDLQHRHTDIFFPRTLIIDKERYPDIDELRKELSDFSKIEVENASVIVERSKEFFLEQYKKRGTSNLSFLTDEEITNGIKTFEEKFKEQDIIQTISKRTFVIARKD